VAASAHHVVILGGGFAGLYAAKALAGRPGVAVTLIDRRNFHLFQPLLYQVATGSLSPGDIAAPIRAVLAGAANVHVLDGEVTDFDVAGRAVLLGDRRVEYDTLLVATGVSHHYFGHDDWAPFAQGLKTVEDALAMRARIFGAFEAAEWSEEAAERAAALTFVVVGAGPTGVELSGSLGELARHTLRRDFRNIDTRSARILLVEGTDRVLPTYPADLAAAARASLEHLGVTVRVNTLVTEVSARHVTVRHGDDEEHIACRTVLWAAGVRASPLGALLAQQTGVSLDRSGRVQVQPDLTLAGHPEILVLGDLALAWQDGEQLPGVAQVAMQSGAYAARLIVARQAGRTLPPFRYRNKGNLAVIGRNAAVADLGRFRFAGSLAWLVWVFVHITYLIEFDSKLRVMLQWAWTYFTRRQGARLITRDG
jgi:NADH dehydrogenase